MKLERRRRNAGRAQSAGRPRSAADTSSPIETLAEYFRWYGIPPSWLHEALQRAAKQAGWIPPWDREEQRSKKTEAGKRSGRSRAGLAQIRHSFINLARAQLTPEQRRSPYSEASIDALEEKYRDLLTKDVSDPDIIISAILSVLSV